MGKDFEFSINEDSARAPDFERVFGSRTVNIKSPHPERITTTDHPNGVMAYFLDIDEITPEQHARLVAYIEERFKVDRAFVIRNLRSAGFPILASEGVVIVKNPARWA